MEHGEYYSANLSSLLTHHFDFADPHGHGLGSHAAHGPEGDTQERPAQWTDGETSYEKQKVEDVESGGHHPHHLGMDDSAAAQIIGVLILEFGVVLHR